MTCATRLTAIVATGHALGTGSLTAEERRELSAGVVAEGNRLAGLVDKLLDLSRLQAGGAEPRLEWCSLEDVLLAALDGLRPHMKYIDRLDDIRRIQDHIVGRAKRHRVPVIANTDIRAQIDAVLELVLASAEQVQRV